MTPVSSAASATTPGTVPEVTACSNASSMVVLTAIGSPSSTSSVVAVGGAPSRCYDDRAPDDRSRRGLRSGIQAGEEKAPPAYHEAPSSPRPPPPLHRSREGQ